MRPSSLGCTLGTLLALTITAPLPAIAQAHPFHDRGGGGSLRPATSLFSGPPKVRTGKERLGDKWTDEQRTDNCKVPIDKRGTTPRPDTCPDALTQ